MGRISDKVIGDANRFERRETYGSKYFHRSTACIGSNCRLLLHGDSHSICCPLVEIAMRKSKGALFALAVVAATAAGTANAVNCYIVLDSKNAVVYQDVFPPVDMSEQGDAARAAIRQRGQFLMMMDALQCPRLIAASGPSGAPATVEQIVAGMRSYGGSRGGISTVNTSSSTASVR
jgi:hypothetical protein